jgi:hypothetical protein
MCFPLVKGWTTCCALRDLPNRFATDRGAGSNAYEPLQSEIQPLGRRGFTHWAENRPPITIGPPIEPKCPSMYRLEGERPLSD